MDDIRTFSYSESLSFDEMVNNLEIGLSKHKIKIEQPDKKEEERIGSILSQFSTINNYDKITVLLVLRYGGIDSNSYLILLTFNSQDAVYSRIPHSIKNVDCELIGLTSINCDPGHVFIRPETFGDKIVELVYPVEIDFPEDKEFSSKYYVICEDKNRLRSNIDLKILRAIKQYDDLHIEILNKFLFARTLKPVNQKSIDTIAGFLKNLNEN